MFANSKIVSTFATANERKNGCKERKTFNKDGPFVYRLGRQDFQLLGTGSHSHGYN